MQNPIGRRVEYYENWPHGQRGPLPAIINGFNEKTELVNMRVMFIDEFATGEMKNIPFCDPSTPGEKPVRYWFHESYAQTTGEFDRFASISTRAIEQKKTKPPKSIKGPMIRVPHGGFIQVLNELGTVDANIEVKRDAVVYVEYELVPTRKLLRNRMNRIFSDE